MVTFNSWSSVAGEGGTGVPGGLVMGVPGGPTGTIGVLGMWGVLGGDASVFILDVGIYKSNNKWLITKEVMRK